MCGVSEAFFFIFGGFFLKGGGGGSFFEHVLCKSNTHNYQRYRQGAHNRYRWLLPLEDCSSNDLRKVIRNNNCFRFTDRSFNLAKEETDVWFGISRYSSAHRGSRNVASTRKETMQF